MDIGTQGLWNKSSGSSGSTNMNDGCSNTWRVQSPSFMTSGHNYAFTSPAFNSSQSSSREDTPPMYVQKSDYQESPYSNAQNSIMSGCKSQVNNGNRTCNRTRFQKNSQQWVDNRSETYNSFQYQADTMQALNNLTLGDTSQERSSSITQMPVELLITNLDQNIDAREMKKILLSWFRELVMVLHVSVFVQSDGYLAAIVTIPSHLDAQYAISQLHRKRIGTKRINISCITQSPQPPELKRSKVVILLKEVPGRKLPLFKFRELYERRYQETIGVSELYNMRDLISVSDNTTGRMVCLNTEFDSLQPFMGDMLQDPDELRYCKIHSKGPDKSVGWAERDHSAILPDVFLTLKEVSNAIRILLKTHSGNIPLASLVECYHTEVGPLEESENGVPLEHLISCLSGVCIVIGPGDFKYVRKSESKCNFDPEDLSRYVSPPLVGHLALFSRELVDLLKTFPHCRMLLSRFIPAYHHHFGRQCRVADYGYTKLADLLASLPHLIQIMGEGNKRTITLSHRVQIKRFSSDLLRVLKGQPSKMITLKAFPEAFEKTIGKPWDVTDYGICDIMDLLREIQETTVVLKNTEDGTLISIPKREQTAEEIERTRLFATEVIELLRHSPECKMQFNRFIPAYHHHFGRQCRLSDYGFSKLIELFEAIPDVLQILGEDEEGERILQLVEKERLRILGDQIFTLVKNSPNQMIGISALAAVFMHYYGYSLK
ncbi:Meiosis arrest female protein 1-like protein, partial [Armadillidium vulgare]